MPLVEARMQTYLLIMGAWLVVAVATAIAYARLAAFGGRADAHLGEPALAHRRRGSWAFPLQIATPLALACAAAVFVADFGLPQEPGRALDAIQDPQPPPVQLAAERPRERAQRRPSRNRAAAKGRGAAVEPGARTAETRVAPATTPVSAAPPATPRARRPQRRRRMPRPVSGPSRPERAPPEAAPSPTPVAATASKPSSAPAPDPAEAPPPTPTPAPGPGTGPEAPASRGPAPAARALRRGSGPPPHAPAFGRRAQQRK